MNRKISELKNLGPKSEEWLNSIGIRTWTDIERVGSIEIYRLLKDKGVPVSLNLVYAIKAGLMGINWTILPAGVKAELKREVRNVNTK
jgi:DNA transformation protein